MGQGRQHVTVTLYQLSNCAKKFHGENLKLSRGEVPPPLYQTMDTPQPEIQAGSHDGDLKPVHTTETQGRFIQWRSKPVHTMEIQAGSHNRDPSRFTSWRSKPVHTMEIQISSRVLWEPLPNYMAFVFFRAVSLTKGLRLAV